MSTFKVLGDAPYLIVTDKSGGIRHLPYARNANNRMVRIEGNRPRLAGEAQDRGYKLLSDCYAEDPRPAIRDNGFKIYLDWDKAVKTGTAPRIAVASSTGVEGGRSAIAPFPEEYLPKEVLDRRKGLSSVSKKTWTPPALDLDDKPKGKRASA